MLAKTGIVWTIKGAPMKEDRAFLSTYVPSIFWNDIECRYWAVDVKLPSGRWLENMNITITDATRITAYIYTEKPSDRWI